MAYAHAQKNCGISGLTVMIIDDNFLKKAKPCPGIPEVCDFRIYQAKGEFPYAINSSAIYSVMKMS